MSTRTEVAIEAWDPAVADEADLRAYHALVTAYDLEILPEDRPEPFPSVVRRLRHDPAFVRVWRFAARTESGLVGVSELRWEDRPSNRHLAWADVMVAPDARGRGVARRLLAPVAQAAATQGITTLFNELPDGLTGAGFASRAGAEDRNGERRSRLLIADVDRAQMEGWVAKAEERAGDYELVTWEGPIPLELRDAFVVLQNAENDAPRGDLDMDDDVATVEALIQAEEAHLAEGSEWWTAAARPRGSEILAAYTRVYFEQERTEHSWQAWTAVDPEHRQRGLARWVKATNVLRVLDERPGVERIDTWNAKTNRAMLAINVEMGFRPLLDYGSWQISTDALACFVGSGSGSGSGSGTGAGA